MRLCGELDDPSMSRGRKAVPAFQSVGRIIWVGVSLKFAAVSGFTPSALSKVSVQSVSRRLCFHLNQLASQHGRCQRLESG